MIILIVSGKSLFAQSLNIGIRGGLNESILDYKPIPDNTNGRLAGFNIGAFTDLGLGNFSIEPGLFYTTKGQKSNYSNSNSDNSTSGAGKVTYNYLEIPLNILYNIHTPIGKVFIGGGPYTAIGLSGTSRINSESIYGGTVTYSNTYNNNKLTFGNTANDVKRQDYGLRAIAGLRLKTG